jgi:hypothetical protein
MSSFLAVHIGKLAFFRFFFFFFTLRALFTGLLAPARTHAHPHARSPTLCRPPASPRPPARLHARPPAHAPLPPAHELSARPPSRERMSFCPHARADLWLVLAILGDMVRLFFFCYLSYF